MALAALQGSIVVMIVGAIVAGATDLTYNPYGYIFVSICAASTAVYLLLIRVLKDRTGVWPVSLVTFVPTLLKWDFLWVRVCM